MTISIATCRIQYSGNGVLDTFAYDFRILAAADLKVIVSNDTTGVETVLAVNTDYTVTGAGVVTGGNVLLTSGALCPTGSTLTIKRNMAITQTTDWIDGQAFSAQSVEDATDKVTMAIQQVNERLGRTPYLRDSYPAIDFKMPSPEASKYLGWNSAATAIENKDGLDTGLVFTPQSVGFTIAGGTTSKTLTVDETASLSDKAAKLLTGYASGAGVVAGTDTVLQAIQKLDGNIALRALNLLTGFVSGAGVVAGTDTVLQAIQKLDGNIAGFGGTDFSVGEVSQVRTQGVLSWVATTTYAAGAVVFGSDGKLYSANASNINYDPTSSPTQWRLSQGDFSPSGPAGWIKFPSKQSNGIILQWGYDTITRGVAFNLPITFPNAILSGWATNYGADTRAITKIALTSTSQMTITFDGIGDATGLFFVALGQ